MDEKNGGCLAVMICFFIANLLGTIVYGCLFVLHREVPLRFHVDVVATSIFGVGCVIVDGNIFHIFRICSASNPLSSKPEKNM